MIKANTSFISGEVFEAWAECETDLEREEFIEKFLDDLSKLFPFGIDYDISIKGRR